MLNIKNQVFITIKIDGQPLEYVVIKDLTLAEGNGAYAPTMRLELDDPTSLLAQSRALSEGNLVEVLISRSQDSNSAEARRYRIFGPTRENNSYNNNILIVGILDSPKYLTASIRSCHTGTSDQVLKEVAGLCGLEYEGPSNGRALNDRQNWWDVCTTRARFVYEVVRHGYMDDKSCMESVVTSTQDLRYRNIIDEINTPLDKIKYVFTHSTLDNALDSGKKEFIVKEARDRSTSGAMANWVNYGSTRCRNNIDGVQKNRKEVQVKAPGQYLAINQEISEMVKRTRFDYAQIDCSNTHKDYENAWYQNLKQLALFTETMSLLVTDVTDIKLLDPIIYRQADADPTEKVRNEDRYIVTGKTIVVRGGVHYAERLQCSRISVLMKGTASLKNNLDAFGDNSPMESWPPSVIPQCSIDRGAWGGAITNMPSVSSIGGILGSIGNLNGQLGGLTSQLPSIMGSVLGPLQNVVQEVLGGAGSAINSALGSVLGPLSSVINQVTSLTGLTQSGEGLIRQLVGTLASQPQSVASTILTGDDSATKTILEMFRLLSMHGVLGNTARTVASLIPASNNYSNYGQFAQYGNAAYGQCQSTASAATNTWNQTLSGYNRQPIPYGYNNQPLPQSPGVGVQNTELMSRLLVKMLEPGMTTQRLLQFFQYELSRQTQGQPNWMSTSSVLPVQQSATAGVQQLSSMLTNFRI